ncbi:SurA N-terminal domain-containing protein [Candidatus Pelagibacter sp.]|nr:SurA N-terminal domain-containing protein [Candidatus Pelagibacter sp.]MDC3139321.1 SurA N-terminal domain-containing protein [Candidatus Pelagibacter sp.]
MISKLRGFSNSKLAGVLVGIIIIPFVFWGMGSVFSGGNTNNVAKINNETISSKDFVNFINESRLTNEIIKANLDKNIIEQILSELVSEKLIEMEIKELNVTLSEEVLANKIRSNSILLDDNKKFSRVKYEKFLLENNLSASTFENSLKKQELKENLFNYISGGIKSPYFLKNKIYINENKKIEIEFLDLDSVHDKTATSLEVEEFIKNNQEILKIDFIDVAYAKITPKDLIEIDEFNDEFFKKIDEIENNIFNGSNLKEINEIYNFELNEINNFVLDDDSEEVLEEIYSRRNQDKIQLVDKNDYYLVFEISNIIKKIPNKTDPKFLENVKNNVILKKKFEFNKSLFEKIDEKSFNDDEFIKLSKDINNIETTTIKSSNDNEVFDPDSLNLLYTLPNKSFSLVTGQGNKVFLTKIKNIYYSDMDKNNDNIKEYSTKANNDIINDVYTSYDLSLNSKYKVKIFNQTIDRVKNYFR